MITTSVMICAVTKDDNLLSNDLVTESEVIAQTTISPTDNTQYFTTDSTAITTLETSTIDDTTEVVNYGVRLRGNFQLCTAILLLFTSRAYFQI